MSSPYASLTAGMLARKGEASPSKDLPYGHKPWQPPVAPVARGPSSVSVQASAPAPAPAAQGAGPSLQDMKVRLQDVASTWPTPKPTQPPDHDGFSWMPAKGGAPLNSFGQPVKTTIRLTHAQARAVKLAALVLDRPQQDIVTLGLLDKLEALACADLAKCSCFQAVIEGLRKPEPAQPLSEP